MLMLSGCDRHTPAWDKMNMAESVMEDHPDSALAVLTGIDTASLQGREEKARYALLTSQALDKNFIDTTSFIILQPAIDYYLAKGTPDQKLRTYYYQGRIFENRGDDDSAMRSYLIARELCKDATDSVMMARLLFNQATVYFKEYKLDEFINCNLEAAKLYGAVGKKKWELKAYAKALNGYTMKENKSAADSVRSVCESLVNENPDLGKYLHPSLFSYTVKFGSNEEIRDYLEAHKDSVFEMGLDDMLDYAQGCIKIEDYDAAEAIISGIDIKGTDLDSMRYYALGAEIYEKQGRPEQALAMFKSYYDLLDSFHYNLLTHDLLFADTRHDLETKKLLELRTKDRIIWAVACGMAILLLISCLLYYRYRLNKAKRIIAEKEAETMEKNVLWLKAEKRKRELENDNLQLEKAGLERERDNLKTLLADKIELEEPLRGVISMRIDMLNGLLAKAIANKESYADPYNNWIESIKKDKEEFMNSTRLAFRALHPKFIEYLEQRGLSVDQINYLCLYAIGLNGKETGEYMNVKSHYKISSEIRKLLGINEHETNIGKYVRRLLNDTDKNISPTNP